MCHHNVEARSIEEIRERHRSEEAGERVDDTPDVEAADDPADEPERPAEPRLPADD
ncbi:hypothetical protein [Halorubrum sp. Boch-26]|uniref:hypothetical protein n=1 Tax=Halorubrum sp. Boch-26 TaxID=2994426 RepID=UPI0024684B8D|nr:hypothetical protein [Halorubrum sp. Boch-26]